MNSSKQIKFGAIISYISIFVGIATSLFYLPWMVSVVGKSDYALYTLASSLISLFLIDFGLSSSVSRFIAKYRAEGNTEKIDNFVSMIFKLYFLMDLLITVTLVFVYIFLDRIYVGLTSSELTSFRILFIIVAVNSIVSFPAMPFNGILGAYEKFVQLKLCELFNKILSVVLIICVLLLGKGVTSVVLMQVLSNLITIILKVVIVFRKINIHIDVHFFDKEIIKEAFSFSIWITVISIAQRCIFNLAPTILGIVSTSQEIAVFSPANALEGYFFTFAAAVNGLFLPTISRYIAQREEKRIIELMIKVGRYQLVVMGLILVGFLCAGKDFMCAWMGESFIMAWPCAFLMFIPDYFLFSQQIANTTITVKNKVKQQSFGYIGMAIICVLLSVILCGDFGVLGSGIAITASYFFLFVYMNIIYVKVLKLDMRRYYKDCYGKLLIPIICVAIVCFLICSKIEFSNYWINVIVKAIITSVIYAIVIWQVITKDEKNFIFAIFQRSNN